MPSEQVLHKNQNTGVTHPDRSNTRASASHAIPQTTILSDILSHLVRFPTISDDGAANLEAMDWVEQQLATLPLHITRLERNGHPNLIATTRKTKNPKVWLAAHMDVVSGSPEAFKPFMQGGQLHGRGTHDMKSAIAIYIALLQKLGQSLKEYDLGLMLTSDEEIGGFDGVKWLLDEHGYRGDIAIIPDSGGSWAMEMSAKGVSWWKVTAAGLSAHAGRVWHGENAIDKIVAFIDNVRTHIIPEPCGTPDHQHNTLNFATITGGASTNQVPDEASAQLDIRFTADTSIDTIKAWMHEAAMAVPGAHAKMLLAEAPYRVKEDERIDDFRRIVREVTGHDVTPVNSHGSSDARHFAVHDIPTINVGPTASGFHVPDEWIDIDDLARFYEVIRQYVEDWAKCTV
jgi:succinyl-diaminopimelate desuccinylase